MTSSQGFAPGVDRRQMPRRIRNISSSETAERFLTGKQPESCGSHHASDPAGNVALAFRCISSRGRAPPGDLNPALRAAAAT